MKFHLDFYARHQQFAGVKDFQVGGKHQTVGDTSCILGGFGYHGGQGSFVIGGEIPVVIMWCCTVGIVGRPLGWEIHLIEPALGSQHGLAIFSVIIQQGFQVSFVMIGVGLRTDQRAIEMQVNLFDDGMGQIVDGPQFLRGVQVIVRTFLQSQFHGKVTASQIHKIVQSRNDEFHGIDTRGGGLDGDHAIGIDANVRRRHLENP